MAIHYSNGIGHLYEKDMPDFPVARVNYNLTELDATVYTNKRWWGDFNAGQELKHHGSFLIDFEEGRKGECIVVPNPEASSKKAKIWYYHFNGRGKLGRR